MSVSEGLRAARALIERPENWSKGALAFRSDRGITEPESSDAVCWCSMGAIRAAVRNHVDAFDARMALRVQMDGCIPDFNDAPGRTHEEVLAAFDRAISLAEQSERGGEK